VQLYVVPLHCYERLMNDLNNNNNKLLQNRHPQAASLLPPTE